ncbi:MAG TPA: pilin [Ramlibacter sp.]|nr:pilin [Ramlibacter sp.]
MHCRFRRAGGFTLIELLVTIAVLAILMLMALPTYLDKLVRDQVAEAMPLANLAKPAVESAWRSGQELPADNAAAGLPPAEQIVNEVVSSVSVDQGAIHIVFGNKAHGTLKGRTLSLRPAVVEGTPAVPVAWLCGRAGPPPPMMARGADRTDVPAGLLPLRCRA